MHGKYLRKIQLPYLHFLLQFDHNSCEATLSTGGANHDIMSAREPESCLQISGERRMTITIAAIAAASSKATNRDIMSAKEKKAAAKQTYSFLAPLTNRKDNLSDEDSYM